MPFNEMVAIKVLNLDSHDTRVLVPSPPFLLPLCCPSRRVGSGGFG